MSLGARRTAVLTLLVKGVMDLEAMAYISEELLAGWKMDAAVATIVFRAKSVARATLEVKEKARLRRLMEEANLKEHDSKVGMNGSVVADECEPDAQEARKTEQVKVLQGMGFGGLGRSLGPAQTLTVMKEKCEAGFDLEQVLHKRTYMMMMEGRGRSLKMTASALRNWHGFAVFVKGYNPTATLPPAREVDVAPWACMFRNGGTAANYVCSVKWVCHKHRLPTGWCGTFRAGVLKGVKKWTKAGVGGQMDKQRLLTEDLVRDLLVF